MNLFRHLVSRHCHPSRYPTSLRLADNEAYFYLYDIHGNLRGYQKYNPLYEKKNTNNPKLARYFTHSRVPSVWGLETLDYNDAYLFVTEGVFDACRVHTFGRNCVAVLGCTPNKLKEQLMLLPFITVALCDGDKAGKALARCTDRSVMMPEGEDVSSVDEEWLSRTLVDY